MFNLIKKIIYSETFWTIISGVLVFILSQILMEKVLKPREKFKNIKGKIFYLITLYANLIFNPCRLKDEDKDIRNNYKEASIEIRKIASEFAGLIESHPIICKKKKYNDIVSNLIGISNGLFEIDSEFKTIEENRKCVNYVYRKFNAKEKF